MTVRKIHGIVKGERWIIIKKKQQERGHITRGRYCKIYKIPPTNVVWSCRKNVRQRIPKTIATATMEGGSNSGRPCNRRRKEVEEDLSIMGIKTGMQWAETVGNGGRFYWKPRSTTDRSA